MPKSVDLARFAVTVGGLLWLAGWALLFAFPQMPDGDPTARAQFLAWYGAGWQHQVRHLPLWNVTGALLAWGALSLALRGGWRAGVWLALLLSLALWGGAQTVGWRGELFLTPGVPARLADSQTFITFEEFTIPPAPDGAGRALQMRLTVNGVSHSISEATPYRGAGWTVRPKWYGALVTHPLLDAPLYLGASGAHSVTLRDGRTITLTVSVESLTLASDPPLEGWNAAHYAIVEAWYPY